MKKIVTIPACEEHQGLYAISLALEWVCPVCGGPRGEPFRGLSYDGSRRLSVDQWRNPCGHVDEYRDVRIEGQRVTQ